MTACSSPCKTASLSELQAALPSHSLFGDANAANTTDQTGIGWQLSPTPYILTTRQTAEIEAIGPLLYQFTKAIDALYKVCLTQPELAWVKSVFHAGKPEGLLTFSQMNRFKHQLPMVIRPDLLVTENGFKLCEIDAVPGGIGFTGALEKAYRQLGFNLIGHSEGMPKAFLESLLPLSKTDNSFIAVVVSDESGDYRPELQWLVAQIQAFYPHIALIHPRQINLDGQRLGYVDSTETFVPIDIVYRFFELYDLPNIPQIELIQYALKKGLIVCTPPFKPHLEEKLVLALIHHPFLKPFWIQSLSESTIDQLQALIPQSWILDSAFIPDHAAVVPPLDFAGHTVQRFSDLSHLSQKQRELVIKPSGFSPLSWGSRGVKVGQDLPQVVWQEVVESALSQRDMTPHLLQRFAKPQVLPYTVFNPVNGEIQQSEGRTRLCPYYFVKDDAAHLAGILATTCPKDKKLIHGMRDGVMRPAMTVADE